MATGMKRGIGEVVSDQLYTPDAVSARSYPHPLSNGQHIRQKYIYIFGISQDDRPFAASSHRTRLAGTNTANTLLLLAGSSNR